MSDETEKMSINVYTTNKDSILKADNSSTEYILKLNEEYNNTNVELRLKISELRDTIDELESTNDKQDSSMRYMRGMLKNYVELKMLYKGISDKNDSLYKINDKELKLYNKYFDTYFNMLFACICMYYTSLMCFVYLGYMNLNMVIISFIRITGCINICIKYYNIESYDLGNREICEVVKRISEGIKEDKDNIKKIEDGSDFLTEYIDNL